MSEYEDFSDQQISHLEMIQAVVARLGSNGFLIKGWAITVTGAFVGFAVDRNRWGLALAGIGPTLLFWLLDTTFLRNERLFRHLFARVVAGQEPAFFMGATGPRYVEQVKSEARAARRKGNKPVDDVSSYRETFRRGTLVLFYLALIATACVAAFFICKT